jgi:two-component system, chemotaxis family, protein-glutamate methylesterase/glutaminase
MPARFPAPILVVLHVPADSPSMLALILARQGPLPVKEAEDGERLENGVIYVAVPDHHLLVDADGTINLARGPYENRHRPAIDALFRSAAVAYGSRALGVVLTGTLDDGTAGLVAIKLAGGIAVVQDPHDAMYPSMPQSALDNVDVDYCVNLTDLSRQLDRIVREPPPSPRNFDFRQMQFEKRIAEMDGEQMQQDERPGQPSAYSCPDCGGVLWEIEEGSFTRYRCRVGHAYAPETMLSAQDERLEEALWTALKTLEESARLSHRLAASEGGRGHDWIMKRFRQREQEARDQAEVIRRFLAREEAEAPDQLRSKADNRTRKAVDTVR